MPKKVDHDARRAEIARAVLAVVVRDGAGAATVRAVAEQAGCSTGVLAHYFADKGEMLGFAVGELKASFTRRLRGIREITDPTVDPRRRLRAVLLQLLPLDDERYDELIAWFALLTLARRQPDPAASVAAGNRDLEVLVSALLRDLGAAHPEDVAVELLCLVDGLALRHVFDPDRLTRTELVRRLDARLGALAPGPHR